MTATDIKAITFTTDANASDDVINWARTQAARVVKRKTGEWLAISWRDEPTGDGGMLHTGTFEG